MGLDPVPYREKQDMLSTEDAEAMRKKHDPHAKPPESMKQLFKYWRKTSSLDPNQSSLDPVSHVFVQNAQAHVPATTVQKTDCVPNEYEQILMAFCGSSALDSLPDVASFEHNPTTAFEVSSLPGLYVFPSLLPPSVQIVLLEKLLHRDLANPTHKTNVDLHYIRPVEVQAHDNPRDIKHSSVSFFRQEQDSVLLPKDPSIHKPITLKQMLESKLRWVTLGGQYDWTNKAYPPEIPPAFPEDIAALMTGLFPKVNPEAAIVNFYSPGDTLSVHRDVSEDCANSLISVSIGCDALFIAGNDDGSQTCTIRLKSGDVLLMSGESRYAWHAVPKILPGTCPSWLKDWPGDAVTSQYQNWRGWMDNKRINLNVRQMTNLD